MLYPQLVHYAEKLCGLSFGDGKGTIAAPDDFTDAQAVKFYVEKIQKARKNGDQELILVPRPQIPLSEFRGIGVTKWVVLTPYSELYGECSTNITPLALGEMTEALKLPDFENEGGINNV